MLLTNSKKSMVGLEGFDLKVVGQKPIPGHANFYTLPARPSTSARPVKQSGVVREMRRQTLSSVHFPTARNSHPNPPPTPLSECLLHPDGTGAILSRYVKFLAASVRQLSLSSPIVSLQYHRAHRRRRHILYRSKVSTCASAHQNWFDPFQKFLS